MKKAILEIDPLWQEIANDSPESLNGRSVNKNSYITGVIGELAVSQALASLGIAHSHDDTYDYDFLAEGIRIDVKSSNSRFTRVGDNNQAMLTDYLRNQNCDAYIFASVCHTDNLVYVMGCCAKFWFWETDCGQDYKAGEKISVRKIKQDARMLKYKHLTSIYELPLLLEALK
jgi:hypothetical protein